LNRALLALAFAGAFGATAFFAHDAHAQRGGMGGGMPGGGAPRGGGSTQSGPVQNKTVGPTAGASDQDDQQQPTTQLRQEPTVQLPADPLAITPEVKARIGTDDPGHYMPPQGPTDRTFYGVYYGEQRGDYRLRLALPFYLDHARGVGSEVTLSNGEKVSGEDDESLYGGLYYRRRSPNFDADVLFPFAWRLRDGDSRIYALGPLAHREAPQAHDNWVAPLVFEGKRPNGGYFHSPLLLTSSHWNEKGAFTIAGPYFRDRTGGDVDMGVAPFWFHGENDTEEGAQKTYTLIPPLLYYQRDREADDNHLTVVGPVLSEHGQKKNYFDVIPFYFSNHSTPESGVHESSRTLFPIFHHATTDEKDTWILPGYYHRVVTTPNKGSDTMLTPFYSHQTTRDGATDLTAIGPIVPVYWRYNDRDLAYSSLGIFPFYFGGGGPATSSLWTPLFAKFETFGVSRTYWAFPNLTVSKDINGWETDLHPIVYLGREGTSSHTVVAPIFWDFDNKKARTTVGLPAFFRYADYTDDSIVQVAANTLYMEKRVPGGKDWQFHLLPLFSYGENPSGYFWNVLFGLAGYTRDGAAGQVRALWIPISTGGGGPEKAAQR
jgi:hypothetical protein